MSIGFLHLKQHVGNSHLYEDNRYKKRAQNHSIKIMELDGYNQSRAAYGRLGISGKLGQAGLAGVFHQRPIGLGRTEKAGWQGKAKREGVVGGNDTEMAGLAILDLGASLDIDF
ncbi:hypothetical protein PPACK8108_LOCUS6557 [Phakopsora pachyrhizi]|uniref:Uncharacterized protein n=1 Tax=Phakopsora pachyrhizi TaxID=170000 RepID=A0AAV0ASI5_PHAPC|nr:hypothetical protein PPACK8108_LOCUS6557 [Phakopsora pachyrhizi]